MSLEQLQGGVADARSDIVAFGLVRYEMLTGRRAFDGASAASVIAAILERTAPSISQVAPASLDRRDDKDRTVECAVTQGVPAAA